MRKLKGYLRTVMAIVIGLLVLLTVYFIYSVYHDGTRWYNSANNTRLQANTDYVIAGSITDRDGTVLASSDAPNTRTYAQDAVLRQSVAHLLGDSYGMTSTSLQQRYKRILYGDEKAFLPKLIETVEQGVIHGESIALSIDAQVQMQAYAAMAGRRGAVVALNYKTGQVICSVSVPTFDPATLTYEQATSAQHGTFVNKVLQGLYPPGSIFKIVTSAALLENGYTNLNYNCVGHNVMTGTPVNVSCYHGAVHGALDLTGAFARSCNGAFAQWTLDNLGAQTLTRTAEDFGFNDNFLFSDCMLYNSSFTLPADDFALAWASVGQDKTLVTPLHAAMIAASVANDGVMMQPRYLCGVYDNAGQVKSVEPISYRRVMDADTAAALTELMRGCVANGTASGAALGGVTVCGKTGTAEVDNEESHAWFVGFIDSEQTPYAVAVVLENAGSGAAAAVPVARSVLQACLEQGS